MRVSLAAVLLLASVGCATAPTPRSAPVFDFHQHLVSPSFAPIVKLPERSGAALLRELDAARIDRAVVLSVGYSFADERKGLPDPDERTRVENDWTAAEVGKNAPRLIGFCSANILRPAALDEIDRCLGLPGMVGIKLHLGNSGISLRNEVHLARVQQVFMLAEKHHRPVLIHMRARSGTGYGAPDAEIFIRKVLPVAPHVEVVVAHFGGAGPGYPDQSDEVMAVFAEAVGRKDPALANVSFDVATIVTADSAPKDIELVALRIRQIGIGKVLYGSDLTPPGGSVRAGWEVFRSKVPLTDSEWRQLIQNRPYFAR
ncbi:MAG: amidohydrolase family protein [Acidobacteria bacterium]|nr:amidohydrolase family protein [Acidobacteriota bacterium]